MEENLQNKDHLESFFKNSFDNKEGTPPSGDWEIPDDSVWDKIEMTLPEDTPKVILYFPQWAKWAAAALLFLLGGVSLSLYFKNLDLNRIIRQQNEITNISDIKQPTFIPNDQKESLTNNKTISQVEKQESIVSTLEDAPIISLKSIQKNTKLSNQNANKINDKTNVKKGGVLSKEENFVVDNSTNNTTQDLISSPKKTIPKITPAIPSLAMAIETNTDRIVLLQKYQPSMSVLEIPKTSNRFFVGLFAGPSVSGKKINNRAGHPTPSFRQEEKPLITTNWGLKLGIHLNKNLDLLTGISKSSVIQKQKRRILFQHEQSNEQQVDNNYVSTYALSVPSSYGTSDGDLELTRPDNSPLTDRVIPISIALEQKVSFTSIPLILKYGVNVGSFKLSILGGVAMNFLNKFESKLEVESLRPIFNIKTAARPHRKPLLPKQTNIDFVAGLELSYNINDRFTLFAASQVQKNIQPFIKNEQFESSFFTKSLQVGGYWNF